MNIFVLDDDPKKAAEYHCNKHVVKMIVESGQMLCTIHWLSLLKDHNKTITDFNKAKDAKAFVVYNTDDSKLPPYSFTHYNHPCTVWASKNAGNYGWLDSLMRSLLDEYTLRYGKLHKCEDVWLWLHDNVPKNIDKSTKMTEHVQCMPDECKVIGNPVEAYRNYYKEYKRRFAKWEPRSNTPIWFGSINA